MAKESDLEPKHFIYTVLLGGYEKLNELTFEPEKTSKYVCFTDDLSLSSKTWNVQYIQPYYPENSIRSSRKIKMFGYSEFPKNAKTLYIDNAVHLKQDAGMFLDEILTNNNIALMRHSIRKNVKNEFIACATYELERQNILRQHYQFYKSNSPCVLIEKPFWGGMIARVNCHEIDNLMKVWDEQYARFSRRDQLSLNFALSQTKVEVFEISELNHDSKWHNWPLVLDRLHNVRGINHHTKLKKMRYLISFGKNGLWFKFH